MYLDVYKSTEKGGLNTGMLRELPDFREVNTAESHGAEQGERPSPVSEEESALLTGMAGGQVDGKHLGGKGTRPMWGRVCGSGLPSGKRAWN